LHKSKRGVKRINLLAKRKSRTPRAKRLTDIRNKLALTQEVLAGKIDVKPGTVAAWESATKGTDYYPSTDILARFAALIAKRGKRFEEDCIWLLKEAGTFTADILRVLDNQRNRRVPARPPKPGEIVSLPFMDAASGYAPGASFVQTIELPASLLREAGSLVCVHIEGTELMNSAPFTPGGLLVIDESETDLELLLEYPPSTPVAVHYARLPNQLPISGPSSRREILDLSHLRGEDEIRAEYAGDAALGPQTKITAEMQKQLGAPGEHAKANEKVNVSGIHVGWLAIEHAGQMWDGAAYRVREGADVPRRIVLRGAEVPGLWGRSTLDLTKWGQGPLGPQSTLADLIIEDVRVLGRVVLWLPEWSPATGAREENV
jgi:DNA-binding XRE family transcriptional regulator